MASYLIKEFENDPNIFIRSSNDNKILNPSQTCTCGSVIFENNLPCTMDFDLGEYKQSFNFNLHLRCPYQEYKKNFYFLTPVNDEYENDLVEFDILDLRWEINEFWDELLNKIKKYHELLHRHQNRIGRLNSNFISLPI